MQRLSTILTVCLLGLTLAAIQPLAADEDDKPRKPPTQVTEKLSRAVFEQVDKAQKALEAQKLDEALALMDQLKAKSDKLNDYEKAQMWNFYAAIHYEQGKTDATIEDYKNILRLQNVPEQLRNNSLFRLAQLYFVKEDYKTAIRVMNKWMSEVESVRPEAHMLVAQAHYQLGNYAASKDAALKAVREARRRKQAPKESWLALLRATYYELGDYPTAAKLLELLVKQYPKPSYYKQLAGMYGLMDQQQKQLAVMHAAYTAGMLESESDILNMARLYMAEDVPYPAVETLKDAMREGLVEQNSETLQLLGQAMALAKEYDDQIPVLEKAAKLSGSAKQYLYLGQAQIALNRWAEAAETLQTALDIGGLDDPGQVHMQIGTAYYNLKNYDRARTAFKRAARYDGTEKQARQWVQFVNQEIKREAAIKEF